MVTSAICAPLFRVYSVGLNLTSTGSPTKLPALSSFWNVAFIGFAIQFSSPVSFRIFGSQAAFLCQPLVAIDLYLDGFHAGAHDFAHHVGIHQGLRVPHM